mmetsp:Transcript_17322/g.19748  ORF Transcript_17322/g.19748 Transcript_17322/m.19748 type:complete len:201 (-) Transcript_17322:130-732(-)
MEDLESFFLNKIKPYEERIQQLEDSEKNKELEIVTLKHAIQNLNRIIEQLKAQQPAGAGAKAGVRGGVGAKSTTGLAGRGTAAHEEEKTNPKAATSKRPVTATGGSSAKDTTADTKAKPGAKDAHKTGKATKAEPAKATAKTDAKKDAKADDKKEEEHHEEAEAEAHKEDHKEENGETEKKEAQEPEKKEGGEEEVAKAE